MHSPLPDASALEAGIIEDEFPSRLSPVQENVRNILRNSRILSVHSLPNPVATPTQTNLNNGLPTPPASPDRPAGQHGPQVLPSPTASIAPPQNNAVPPSDYQEAVQQMAHQSTWFNSRAVAALNHPDLTDPSLEAHLRREEAKSRQSHAWKRSRRVPSGRSGGSVYSSAAASLGSSQSVLCVFAALMLAATVATYIVLATTSQTVSPTFHILFVLGIILATIVFSHAMIRLLIFNTNRHRPIRKTVIVAGSSSHHRHNHHHRRRHRNRTNHHRNLPPTATDPTAFVPRTPIQVHMPSDDNDNEARPDSREAHPTASVSLSPQEQQGEAEADWDKDIEALPNPPPAYGRWRGSVRANPDLLHWRVVPSSVVGTPVVASPTYEEVVDEDSFAGRPPSYVTRDSPARARGVEVEGLERRPTSLQARVDEVVDEDGVEMVEVRGIGFAM